MPFVPPPSVDGGYPSIEASPSAIPHSLLVGRKSWAAAASDGPGPGAPVRV